MLAGARDQLGFERKARLRIRVQAPRLPLGGKTNDRDTGDAGERCARQAWESPRDDWHPVSSGRQMGLDKLPDARLRGQVGEEAPLLLRGSGRAVRWRG